jgi:hypothetical protein
MDGLEWPCDKEHSSLSRTYQVECWSFIIKKSQRWAPSIWMKEMSNPIFDHEILWLCLMVSKILHYNVLKNNYIYILLHVNVHYQFSKMFVVMSMWGGPIKGLLDTTGEWNYIWHGYKNYEQNLWTMDVGCITCMTTFDLWISCDSIDAFSLIISVINTS